MNESTNSIPSDDGPLQNEQHPLSYVAKSSDPDTMTLNEAMKQVDKEQFIEAMEKEIMDHCTRGHWEIVPISSVPRGNRPIMAVWAMKRKRDPAGEIIKWKARLCAHGGQQTYGVNYWDTYAPVVSWTSVRLVFIIAVMMGWNIRQIDFVLAYPQATLKHNIFMKIPSGVNTLHTKGPHLLKLIKNLYGLKDAGRTWYQHIDKGLQERGFEPSKIDPCVYFKGQIILIIYVDDACIIGPDKTEVENTIASLKRDFALTDEGEVENFLGIKIKELPGGKKLLIQPKLVDRFIELVGIKKESKTHDTPADRVLQADKDHREKEEPWNYRSAVGILTFIQASTRPDLTFPTHQAAKFSVDPRVTHEKAIKRIARYLLKTKDKGLIIDPKNEDFEVYVDADFAGAWTKENSSESENSRSRTGYVIMYGGCPVLWVSKLQTLVALSTTEAEYIALSTAMRDVRPMMTLLQEMKERGLPIPTTSPTVKCRVHEDNVGAVELATEYKYRPRTKHISVCFHHFHDLVKAGTVKIQHISTKEQLADIFTKPLPKQAFEYLRDLIMGTST
jgi:hypothetical protein